MKAALNRAFQPDGIEITEVIIKGVTLPPSIQRQLEEKTTVDSRNKSQRMQQKKDVQSTQFTEAIQKLTQSNVEAMTQATVSEWATLRFAQSTAIARLLPSTSSLPLFLSLILSMYSFFSPRARWTAM